MNILIMGFLGVAFALRLYRLASVPLNIDEIATISKYIPLPLLEIFTTSHSNNHPLTSALAHLFSPHADDPFLMRWPSVLVGMLALPFVYRLGTLLFGRRVGLLALLLLTVAPVHIGYTMIIRGYGGLITLTTCSVYLLCRASQSGRWSAWAGFIVVNSLIIYYHLFGVLAVAEQMGLAGLWLVGQAIQDKAAGISLLTRLRRRLTPLGVAALGLGLTYAPTIYIQATSITTNERWPNSDFAIWQNNSFSFEEDLFPLTFFVGLMAPLSPAGLAKYLYLILVLLALLVLWVQPGTLCLGSGRSPATQLSQQRVLVGGLILWFITPFIVIFTALQLFGPAFYAYVRFLLYLMPAYLSLVALGLVKFADILLNLVKKQLRWQWPARLLLAGGGVGLLAIFALSSYWYALTTAHTDWLNLSHTLEAKLQPHDLTICEEHQRGFPDPDRAKPHCIWMLTTFVEQLREIAYSPRFQSSTDFIADYDNLLDQRQEMVRPGRVWLIIWQKIPFRPDDLAFVTARPPLQSPPVLTAFAPYQAWHFGSATLVQLDSEATLLGNLSQTLELLLSVEPDPADQARYYRSLAEIEAVQGHKGQAQAFLAQSRSRVQQAGGEYPAIFLAETWPLIERLPEPFSLIELAVTPRVDLPFGPSLCLQGYQTSPKIVAAGETLRLNIYWQTLDFLAEEYTFALRLEAVSDPNAPPAQLLFKPFEGTYPTTWWWRNQSLTMPREFHFPPDLLPQDYVVHLAAYSDVAGEVATTPLFLLKNQSSHWQIEPAPTTQPACDLPPVDLSAN